MTRALLHRQGPLRRRGRRVRLGVDLRGAFSVVATFVKWFSLALAVPALVALGYGEPPWPFLVALGAGWAGGFVLERATAGPSLFGPREAFLVVSVTWLLVALVSALPFVLADEPQLARPLDAYFEAMSGLTTTGSSVVVDVSELDRSLVLWRQLTQWLGGMGIIVLALAVLPRLRVGGRQLLEHELPGPEFDPLASRIRDTARRLWLLYVALTALLVAVLCVVGWVGLDDEMSPFEAVAHAFTTMPTGGFSTRVRSLEEFGAVTQWVVTAFMLVAGVNFALLYRAALHRSGRPFLRDEELRVYLTVAAVAAVVLAVELWAEGLARGEAAVRHALFQTVSITTTTGFASADFNEWTLLGAVLLVALMFAGGSAGSTAGGVKIVRHLLMAKILRRELAQTVHPELVQRVRLNGRAVDEKTLRAVLSFTLLYAGIFAVGALLLVADAARVDLDLGALDAIAAAATTLGNIGPAFGPAGPMGSFEPFSDVSTTILIGLMWLGRLEIVPVVVLLTRSYWRG